MALERCMAFLLADEFDSEELVDLRVLLRARGTGGFDDDDDDEEDDEGSRNYFSATVPSLSVLDFQKCFQLSHPQVEMTFPLESFWKMALERCMAFLLADEFDSEELVDLRVLLKNSIYTELVNLLSPCDWATRKLEGWTVTHAVLASLWTLSTSESLSSVAARFHTSESLIHLQLNDFCLLIAKNFPDQIRWPRRKEAEASAAGFLMDVGLPGTVCVLGTCSIPIDRPADVPDPEVYRDPVDVSAYSVTLMAFCEHRGCFTFVSAEHPGSWHDSRVLLKTDVGKALRDDPMNLLHGKHVVADAAFPLSEHLLTPFPDYGMLGEKKLRYNLRIQAALRVVQGSLRSLRSRFQRLTCLLLNSVEQTELAVRTCCILYNMYLETDYATVGGESVGERAKVQMPFHELQYGHSGSLGGISKRQDVAASLGRKNTKKKVNLKFSSLVLGDLNLFQQENSLFTKPAP